MSEKEKLIMFWRSQNIVSDEKIIEAFKKVPREEFLENNMKKYAYLDTALPSLEGQTISQPTTIMIMLNALELRKSDIVLEIGAGTGYSAALMSSLAKEIYSLEMNQALCKYAEENLSRQKITNVRIINGDGTLGFLEKAPFDKIVATAAVPKIPKTWIEQTKENGIIVAPVGLIYSQSMIKAKKIKSRLVFENLGAFVFVPSQGRYGFAEKRYL